ncbi:hypothetical protein HDK90DRAFT_259484 [Phyllosticta capitalensis]|uniref:Uncharacterized protein n=1 Tax=Phyllosticta capitalensis TaxID=121624 RepID=A0ABR1YR48_9PEZI
MGFASASRAFGACFNELMLPAVLMAAIASPQTRLSDSLSSPCASSFQLWDCFTTVMASLFRHLLNTINSTALCAPLTLFHLSRISLPADPEERLRRSSRPHVSPSRNPLSQSLAAHEPMHPRAVSSQPGRHPSLSAEHTPSTPLTSHLPHAFASDSSLHHIAVGHHRLQTGILGKTPHAVGPQPQRRVCWWVSGT